VAGSETVALGVVSTDSEGVAVTGLRVGLPDLRGRGLQPMPIAETKIKAKSPLV
jgi:hypothetical protein